MSTSPIDWSEWNGTLAGYWYLLAKQREEQKQQEPEGKQVVGVHYSPEPDHDRPPGAQRP